MQTTKFDVIVVGSGASGGWAAKRLSEAGIKVALLEAGQAASRQGLHRARPRVRAEVPRQGERPDAADASEAARLLRVPRVELQVVRQRPRGAVHQSGRQAVQLAGPHPSGRRPHQRLGPAELSAQRAGSEGQVVRRVRRGLAAQLQGSGPLLRAGRGLRRHHRPGGKRPGTARQQVPSRDADELRRDAAAHAGEGEAGLDGHHRPRGQHHQADQRPGALPLLRAVRAGVRDALVFQLRVHDGRRRAEVRQHHAHHRRDGLQGPHGPVDRQGDRRDVHRPGDARGEGGQGARGAALRAGAGVDPHPAELGATAAWPTRAACSGTT